MPLLAAFIVPHPPLIVPAVGRGQEHEIQKTTDAYLQIGREIAALAPETIIVISPHSVMYADYLHISPGSGAGGDLGGFGAKDVSIKKQYDEALVSKLTEIASNRNIPAGTMGEKDASLDHGVLVPLYFIDQFYASYRMIRIGISGLSPLTHYRFGQCIADAAEALSRRIVIIASGDLSHKLKMSGPYGFAEEGPDFDSQITEAMGSGDFLRFLTFQEDFTEAAAECGLRSFIIMAGALNGRAVKSELLSYEGPFGVGYGIGSYKPLGTDDSRKFGDLFETQLSDQLQIMRSSEDEYVRLARTTLETYIKSGVTIDHPKDASDELLNEKAGVFVSLKKEGRLRGCIGTISATEECIADEIIRNAIQAGTQDPRFDPVEEEELDKLVYSIDVLGAAEPVTSTQELDAKRYGVIVTLKGRRGLLLPNLEGVNTPEEQISIALQKAGIGAYENYHTERFEVVRHK